jgi:hypothetical protein
VFPPRVSAVQGIGQSTPAGHGGTTPPCERVSTIAVTAPPTTSAPMPVQNHQRCVIGFAESGSSVAARWVSVAPGALSDVVAADG